MQQVHGFDVQPLEFDKQGDPEDTNQIAELQQHVAAVTDVVFIAHGFRNNVEDATGWYSEFLQNFRRHVVSDEFRDSLDSRKWLIVFVYWPSKALPEGPSADQGHAQALEGDIEAQRSYIKSQLRALQAELGTDSTATIEHLIALIDEIEIEQSQDDFVEKLFSLLDLNSFDSTEGIHFINTMKGSEILSRLRNRRRPGRRIGEDDNAEGGAVALPGGAPADKDVGAAQGLGSFFKGVLGKVGQVINLTTWYLMKERSGSVGDRGLAKAVRSVKAANPNIKVHLVGHSLGGRLMAACAKSLASNPRAQPDSVTLLQAAFSHYGFSKQRGGREEGFFRAVVDSEVIKGPFLATFSSMDDVVGRVYAIASMLAGDNVQAVGDRDSEFGGIGANGAQQLEEGKVLTQYLHNVGQPYQCMDTSGLLLCLDGSANLITNHGDITNPAVTYAFTSAVAAT